MSRYRPLLFGLTAGLALWAWSAPAQPPAEGPARPAAAEPAQEVPTHDVGFERFGNLEQVSDAWRAQDAALLADLALQFAEGERVLLRPHAAVKASQILELAARAASEKGDKATLDRLAKAAGKVGSPDLAERVALAAKAAGGSRSANPALTDGTPESLDAVRAVLAVIESAKASGDPSVLASVAKGLADLPITEAQRAALRKAIDDAEQATSGGPSGEMADLVSKLRGTGRGWVDPRSPEVNGTFRKNTSGQLYRENLWFWKDSVYVIDRYTTKKNWFGQTEVVIGSGHHANRQSSEYVKMLWNPKPGVYMRGKTMFEIHSSDLNSIRFMVNGKWAPWQSLTVLMEGGQKSGSVVISKDPTLLKAGGASLLGQDGASIVAAGGGNIVAAGGGNIVAAGGMN